MRTVWVWIAAAGIAAGAGCGSPHRDGNGGDGGSGSPDAPPVNLCKVTDDSNGVPNCTDVAPANSFDPDIQWTWMGPNGETNSIVTPLVANLTDDNGDGAIDLCDIPDVVVVASTGTGQPEEPGHIYLLNGQTGAQELMIPTTIDGTVTPALGDLDGDGVAEIVTVDTTGKLWAFHHDGTVLFGPAGQWAGDWYSGAIALADLDHDGHVEILGGNTVFDDHGVVKWSAPSAQASWNASTAADLDGDGYMEVVLGASAYHYDGTVYYNDTGVSPGYPQVANLDDDPEPEILVTNTNGLTVLEHDGTVKYQDLRPTGSPAGGTTWLRPATIHDFDGNGKAEYAMSSANYYTEYNADATIKWSAPVSDQSGIAAGTAFDFLGDGHAEAMYADEQYLYVFDSTGTPIFKMPRTSGTLSEYPVVADIDNDGSAEIVVVSNMYITQSPTVQVIRDKQDRWIQARRIWNEHAYHVTNVREDGTIPQFEQPSWQRLNTFRTNAQISGGAACQPIVL
ncbi:MAG: FG-GAP-like repeat-containing protein [Kofleriaceae bacterium]